MRRILLVCDDALAHRLEGEALERRSLSAEKEEVPTAIAEIDCVRGGIDNLGGTDQFSGVVIGLDFLSLRLIGVCDALAIPLVVVAGADSSKEALAAFGVESALTPSCRWAEILAHLGIEPEDNDSTSRSAAEDADDEAAAVGSQLAKVIAVWGPAGAPGRSVLAINLACEIALAGRRVLLIDADTYGGSIAGYLELFDEAPGFLATSRLAGLGHLDRDEFERLAHDFQCGDARLRVLSGIVNSKRWPELTTSRVRSCIEVVREFFDAIVIDVGFNLEEDEEISSDLVAPRRNQATLEVLRSADGVVAVTASDVISVARYIQSLSVLTELIGHTPVTFVANRVHAKRSSGGNIVRHTLSRFAGVTDVHLIDDDAMAFAEALERAAPLCVVAPKSTVRSQIRQIAQSLA